MGSARAVAALAVTLVVSIVSPAAGQIYRWTDDRGVAHYAEGLDSVPERYRDRAVPLGLRRSPPVPAGPAAATGSPAGVEVRFVPGQHIVVEARVNGSAAARLILDTGAAATLISPRVLAAAGASLTRGTVPGRTRGIARDAELQVDRVRVDSLEVGEARVGPLMVAAYDMDMEGVDGLLGHDFLARFNVSIDPAAGLVRLTPR